MLGTAKGRGDDGKEPGWEDDDERPEEPEEAEKEGSDDILRVEGRVKRVNSRGWSRFTV